MCRFFAYSGKPVWLDRLLIEPEQSLVSQSMAAREAKTVVNGDGCGIGWYGERATPAIFRDTQPAWSDKNLASLCHHTRSGMFMAHVRSATSGEVTRANCHPFALGAYLFMHNGQIGGYERIRRSIEALIPNEYYSERRGTGDSEAIFLAAAGHGLERDPVNAISIALGLCRREMAQAGVSAALRFSAMLMDGTRTYAFRWSSDSKPPTLYWCRLDHAIAFSSEPFSFDGASWTLVEPNTVMHHDGSVLTTDRFDPSKAAA
jgi:glutamine amidotransferase